MHCATDTVGKVTKIILPRIEDFVIPKLFTSFDEHWWEQQTLNFSTQQLDSLNKKSFGDDFPVVDKTDKAKKSNEAPYVSTGSSA